MTGPMCRSLVAFMAGGLSATDLDELLLRGLIALDQYDSLTITTHGRRVFDLIKERGIA